jgi:hypothetical protein
MAWPGTQSLGSILMLVGFSAIVGYLFGLLRSQTSLRKAVMGLRREFDVRIQRLEASAPAPPARSVATVTLPVSESNPPTPLTTSHPAESEEISPDTLLIIAAAVTAFLGKKVRVRSAKMLQSPYEIVNPWAQQGRVFVQASHNLARGRE